MAIVINKAAVRRTLEAWFIAARAGQTLGAVETAKLSAADAAAQSSDYIFDTLSNDEDAFQYEEPAKANAVVELWAAVDITAGTMVVIGTDGAVTPAEVPQADSNDFFA